MQLPYFNSIKVRLRLVAVPSTSLIVIFQFHKGSIKTVEDFVKSMPIVHFNSIKVRLRPDVNNSDSVSVGSFQFHKGSIKTQETSESQARTIISIP